MTVQIISLPFHSLNTVGCCRVRCFPAGIVVVFSAYPRSSDQPYLVWLSAKLALCSFRYFSHFYLFGYAWTGTEEQPVVRWFRGDRQHQCPARTGSQRRLAFSRRQSGSKKRSADLVIAELHREQYMKFSSYRRYTVTFLQMIEAVWMNAGWCNGSLSGRMGTGFWNRRWCKRFVLTVVRINFTDDFIRYFTKDKLGSG